MANIHKKMEICMPFYKEFNDTEIDFIGEGGKVYSLCIMMHCIE